MVCAQNIRADSHVACMSAPSTPRLACLYLRTCPCPYRICSDSQGAYFILAWRDCDGPVLAV